MYKHLLAATTVLAVASPVLAHDTASRVVPYRDLDLASPAGQETLRKRLDGAVNAVCGQVNHIATGDWQSVRRCRLISAAKANADAQVVIAAAQLRSAPTLARGN